MGRTSIAGASMRTDTCALAVPLALVSWLVAPSPVDAQQRETRQLSGFDAISVGGGIDLFLRQGDTFLVEVESSDGELDEIVTEVRAGTLEIKRKRSFGFFDWGDHGSVSVTLPKLVSLTASGGSDARSGGPFTSDSLSLVASGGSDVDMEVAAATLQVQASGGSDVRLSGSARSANVHSSGGSDFNASGLQTEEADLHSSGGSDLSIAVRDRIVANASGGSDITYSGEPRSVNVNASGGSDIRRR